MSILLLLTCRSFSQQFADTVTHDFTKAQMYSDFDFFTGMVQDIDPQLEFRKKVTGVNVIKKLEELRTGIETVKNDQDFYVLLRKAIDGCNDGHANMLWAEFLDQPDKDLQSCSIDSLTEKNITKGKIASKNAFDAYRSFYKNIKLRLPVRYIDGDYFITDDFTYKNKVYPAGLIISKFNGEDVHEFVKNNVKYEELRWDYKNKRLYLANFYRDPGLVIKPSFTILFKGRNMAEKFNYADTVSFPNEKPKPRNSDKTPFVHYFKNSQILYVRVPSMEDDLFHYTDSIKAIGKINKIKTVVIDIRGNGGGDDDTGLDILRSLIKDTIKTTVRLCANPSDKIVSYFKKNGNQTNFDTISFFNNKIYLSVQDALYTINPDSSSIKFNGNIYILQDENIFSAAGTLAAVAGYSKQVINIGSQTGYLLGKGATPVIFQLPVSKVMFRMEPVIDFSNSTKPADVFHDQIKVPIDLSFNEWVFRRNYRGDVYSEKYLLKHDPVFMKIIQLENIGTIDK